VRQACVHSRAASQQLHRRLLKTVVRSVELRARAVAVLAKLGAPDFQPGEILALFEDRPFAQIGIYLVLHLDRDRAMLGILRDNGTEAVLCRDLLLTVSLEDLSQMLRTGVCWDLPESESGLTCG